MIRKKTVFVLGAGASYPYGFPLGSGLVKEIISADLNDDPCTDPSRLLRLDPRTFRHFQDQLNQSNTTSIDRFLENRENWREIGKKAIAWCLIRYEEPSRVFTDVDCADNWMKYLLNSVLSPDATFETFADNPVSFITYNYDRSLEFAIFNFLRFYYGKTDQECFEVLGKIPIVHIHGMLAPFQPIDFPNIGGRKYESDLSEWAIDTAANHIRIIYEGEQHEPHLEEAGKLLSEAEQVLFLGFGFDKVNVERLQLSNYPSAWLYGTAYGLLHGEKAVVNSRVVKLRTGQRAAIRLGEDNQDSSAFLAHHANLLYN